MNAKHPFILLLLSLFCACKPDPVPKPRAMLRLDYLPARYETFLEQGYYQFRKNTEAIVSRKKEHALNIAYPRMKATLFITYKPVNNNLEQLLQDVQKLTYEHIIKADKITETPFVNNARKTYGMLYEVSGNAASQLQFYVTDSAAHFLTGALYFRARPNYDSLLPAVHYLKNDIKKIMETLQWHR
ncbi:MAG: gliding motility lipoprotein GldD [Sinomicrobium sp.]|nr:gliding motility lipoprotein GldD [Sinomicrobium sp.]